MDGFEFQFLRKGVELFGLQLCTLKVVCNDFFSSKV
jgi:hypothetical protein